MEGKLLFVLLVVASVSGGLAIDCYVCEAGGFCQEGETGEIQACPVVDGLVTVVCMNFSGTIVDNGVTFEGIIRNCNPSLEDIGVGCVSDDFAVPLRGYNFLDSVTDVPTAPQSEVVILGDLCICDSDGCNGKNISKDHGTGGKGGGNGSGDDGVSVKPLLWLVSVACSMHMLMM